jgi:hypothetical protein
MAKKGQPPAYEYCDSMDVLVAGANRAATPLSASRILAGVDAAGALSLSEFTLDYGAGRRDGVLRARSFRYNTGCSCLRYTSAWYAVP